MKIAFKICSVVYHIISKIREWLIYNEGRFLDKQSNVNIHRWGQSHNCSPFMVSLEHFHYIHVISNLSVCVIRFKILKESKTIQDQKANQLKKTIDKLGVISIKQIECKTKSFGKKKGFGMAKPHLCSIKTQLLLILLFTG